MTMQEIRAFFDERHLYVSDGIAGEDYPAMDEAAEDLADKLMLDRVTDVSLAQCLSTCTPDKVTQFQDEIRQMEPRLLVRVIAAMRAIGFERIEQLYAKGVK